MAKINLNRVIYITPFLLLIFLVLFSFKSQTEEKVKENILQKLFTLENDLENLEKAIRNKEGSEQYKILYRAARKSYKLIEVVVEFVAPSMSKYYLNGPPIMKHDLDKRNVVYEPHGFQQLEILLYNYSAEPDTNEMLDEIRRLKESVSDFKDRFKRADKSIEEYFMAFQFGLIRIVTMNLNGYDCALTKENGL